MYVLTTSLNGRDNGCIVRDVMVIDSDQKKICLCIKKSYLSCCMINRSKKFNLSITNGENEDLVQRFGMVSGKAVDKFEGFRAFKRADNGVPYITKNTDGYMSVDVDQVIDLGTHAIFIGKVTDEDSFVVYKCKVCGHQHYGWLDDDFKCPVCSSGRDAFERV
ncbi:MAG: flavin reductase [Clostridia bacterium]|nr:flavin reductase [Clostridia bacterium]